MKIKNVLLVALPTFIWSSTWFVIKFQVGTVDPLVSVFYRFMLAAMIMFAYCLIAKKKLNYRASIHGLFVLEGIFLFGINYWLIYIAELYLTSGLIAVIFSLIVFFNIIFSRLFLKRKIQFAVLLAGVFAFVGILFIFEKEIRSFNLNDNYFLGLVLCLGSLIFASLGNIVAARISELKVHVVEANTFGMLYGSLSMLIIIVITGTPMRFDSSFEYLTSLLYLIVFGSIIAFWSYIKTVVRIGPARAAYALVMIPIISMFISTIFENYKWTTFSLVGIGLIVLGNVMVIRNK